MVIKVCFAHKFIGGNKMKMEKKQLLAGICTALISISATGTASITAMGTTVSTFAASGIAVNSQTFLIRFSGIMYHPTLIRIKMVIFLMTKSVKPREFTSAAANSKV